MVNPSLSIGWWGLLKIKLVHDPTVKLCKNVIILIVTGIYLFWALVRGWDTCWSVISKSHSFTSEAQSRGFRSQCQELLRLQGSPRGFVFWKTSFTKRLLISWIISWIIMTWWVTLPTPHYIYIYIYILYITRCAFIIRNFALYTAFQSCHISISGVGNHILFIKNFGGENDMKWPCWPWLNQPLQKFGLAVSRLLGLGCWKKLAADASVKNPWFEAQERYNVVQCPNNQNESKWWFDDGTTPLHLCVCPECHCVKV